MTAKCSGVTTSQHFEQAFFADTKCVGAGATLVLRKVTNSLASQRLNNQQDQDEDQDQDQDQDEDKGRPARC